MRIYFDFRPIHDMNFFFIFIRHDMIDWCGVIENKYLNIKYVNVHQIISKVGVIYIFPSHSII